MSAYFSPSGKAAYIALTFATIRRFEFAKKMGIAKVRMSYDSINAVFAIIMFLLAGLNFGLVVQKLTGPIVAIVINGPLIKFFYTLFSKLFPFKK
jgi:hypothetical protein